MGISSEGRASKQDWESWDPVLWGLDADGAGLRSFPQLAIVSTFCGGCMGLSGSAAMISDLSSAADLALASPSKNVRTGGAWDQLCEPEPASVSILSNSLHGLC